MRFTSCVVAVLLAAAAVQLASAHMRWNCPAPRNPDTGLKTGPCGGGTTNGQQVNFNPGWNTVVFEESISHTGAPFRIALSQDGSDTGYGACVLLDHIPHNDAGTPVLGQENTYVPYAVSIYIPDVDCKNCALQIINPMTDKIATATCKFDETCDNAGTCSAANGECFSVYHSCANIRINGKTKRSQFTCPPPSTAWPYQGTANIYGKESATWTGAWLASPTMPADFITPAGPCANKVAAPVIPTVNPSAAPLRPPPTVVSYQAMLTADAPILASTSSAFGVALFYYDSTTMEMSINLGLSLSRPGSIEIRGPATTNTTGPVLFAFSQTAVNNPDSNMYTYKTTITAATLKVLSDIKAYIVVNTQQYPNGEIRGEIGPISSASQVMGKLDGAQALLANPSATYTGIVMVNLDYATKQLAWVVFHNLGGNANGITLNGPAQAYTTASVKLQLSQSSNAPAAGRTRPLTQTEEKEFRAGLYSVVVPSRQNQRGEIKAQLLAPSDVISKDPLGGPVSPYASGAATATPNANGNGNGNGASNQNGGTEVDTTTKIVRKSKNGVAIAFAIIGWVLAMVAGVVLFLIYKRNSDGSSGGSKKKVPDEDNMY